MSCRSVFVLRLRSLIQEQQKAWLVLETTEHANHKNAEQPAVPAVPSQPATLECAPLCRTALFLAAVSGSAGVLSLLITAGAEVCSLQQENMPGQASRSLLCPAFQTQPAR